jgi:hypothetical protein
MRRDLLTTHDGKLPPHFPDLAVLIGSRWSLTSSASPTGRKRGTFEPPTAERRVPGRVRSR